MADRDYHELGDKDLRDRLAKRKPADAKELPQPAGIEKKELPQPRDAEIRELASGPAWKGSLPTPGTNVTFSQLPDGRMFFTVELPAGGYEKLMMADRQALLDAAVAQIRAQLATLWSIGA